MAVVLILAGEPGGVIRIAPIPGLVFLGLAAVSDPIAFVWYANRILVRFTLSPDGVRYETLARKDKTVNRALIVLGLLLARPGASGAGLLAAVREAEFTRWREVRSVRGHPSRSVITVITLKSRWRVLQRFYCPPGRFTEIARYVRGHVARAPSAPRRARSGKLNENRSHSHFFLARERRGSGGLIWINDFRLFTAYLTSLLGSGA